jgi:MoaA/NifB/PqqE/SkfB family radical SAM enzyme
VSRAFLRDDAEGEMPRRNYALPERDDPEYERAAARALLEAARVNETQLAERATGFYWGEPLLRPHVEEILAEAERAGDDRLEQVARRYLR